MTRQDRDRDSRSLNRCTGRGRLDHVGTWQWMRQAVHNLICSGFHSFRWSRPDIRQWTPPLPRFPTFPTLGCCRIQPRWLLRPWRCLTVDARRTPEPDTGGRRICIWVPSSLHASLRFDRRTGESSVEETVEAPSNLPGFNLYASTPRVKFSHREGRGCALHEATCKSSVGAMALRRRRVIGFILGRWDGHRVKSYKTSYRLRTSTALNVFYQTLNYTAINLCYRIFLRSQI